MAKSSNGESTVLRPTSPSLNSSTFLASDVSLNIVDPVAVAEIVREQEDQPPVSSSPSKPSGPSSAEKLRRLVANQKVPVKFDAPQKVFARPSSAGKPPAVDGFSFGKVNRRGGNSAQLKVQKPHENSSPLTDHEASQPLQKGPGFKPLAHSTFDLDGFDLRPLHMVAQTESEAKQVSHPTNNTSLATPSSGKRATDTGNEATTSSLSEPVTKTDQKASNDTRPKSVSIECQPSSSKSTHSAKARQSMEKAQTPSCPEKRNSIATEDTNMLKTHSVTEGLRDNDGGIVPSIESHEDANHSQPASRASSHDPLETTNMLSKILDPARITKHVSKSEKRPGKKTQTYQPGVPFMEEHSEEDLFMLLLNRVRQHKASNTRTVARQKQMASTINQLCQTNDNYQSQLKEAKEAQRTHLTAIKEQKRASDELKVKFGGLKNFVKGLTNDLESIRKEGDTIRKSQSQVVKSGYDLLTETSQFHVLQESSVAHMNKVQSSIAELRTKLDSVTNINAKLQAEIEKEQDLLQEEKRKTAKLELQVKIVREKSDQRVELLESQSQLFMDRVEHLPRVIEKLDTHFAQTASLSPDLRECLETVKTLQASERVLPSDIQSLKNAVVAALAERIESGLGEARVMSKTCRDDSRDAYQQMGRQLTNILQDAKKAETHAAEIASLQETRIRLEERLLAKADVLDDANAKVNELSIRERSLLESIPQMKNELTSIREKCPSNPPSPDKGSSIDYWKSLVEEYRVKWTSINSEKVELARELTANIDELKRKSGLVDEKERSYQILAVQNEQLKRDLQHSEEKFGAIYMEELDRTKALITRRETEIGSITSELHETVNALHNVTQAHDNVAVERSNLEEQLSTLRNQFDNSMHRENSLAADNEKLLEQLKDIDLLRKESQQVPRLHLELEHERRKASEQANAIVRLEQEAQKFGALEADLAYKASENTQLAKQIKDQARLQDQIERLKTELETSIARSLSLQDSESKLEGEAARVESLLSEIADKETSISELQNQLSILSGALEELKSLRDQTQMWSEKYNEVQEKMKSLYADVDKKNLLEEELKRKNGELSAFSELSLQLATIQNVSQRKDSEIQQLRTEVKKLADISHELRRRLSQWEGNSQDSVWSQETQILPSLILDGTTPIANSQSLETPDRTIITSSGRAPMPHAPSPPRHRRIADRRSCIPESSFIVRERLAAAKASQQGEGGMTQSTSCVPETQYQPEEHYSEEESSSDLSEPPESSPIKVDRPSFHEESRFRQTTNETIDDSQIHPPPKSSKLVQRRIPGNKQMAKERSWTSRSSNQGEEMLLERQSQTGSFTEATEDQSPGKTASAGREGEGNDNSFELPRQRSKTTAFSKHLSSGAVNDYSATSKRASNGAPGKTVPNGHTPVQLGAEVNLRARHSGTLTERSPSYMNVASSVSPTASTLKGRHQPNSGAKRQLDSDGATENLEQGSSKILKRNTITMNTRKDGSASVSFPDQMPDPDTGSRSDQRPHASLPAGSKKGSVGGKSSNSSGASAGQKRDRKPRKGSRAGDQYGNRFGRDLH